MVGQEVATNQGQSFRGFRIVPSIKQRFRNFRIVPSNGLFLLLRHERRATHISLRGDSQLCASASAVQASLARHRLLVLPTPSLPTRTQTSRDLATVYMSRFFTGLIRTRAAGRLNESVKQSLSIHGFVELQVVLKKILNY